MWTAEDGSTSNFPFGVHQIYEEIVAPVVQNLLQENRIERMKIYNHIKDQKIDYLNKWHQDTDNFYRANRSESTDIINLMQESLREYVAAYNTLVSLQKTEDSMVLSGGSLDSTVVNVTENTAETLLAFEMQSKEFQNIQTNFEEYMERLKEDIDIKADKFGYIEYYDAKLRDGHSNEIAVAASEVRDLDERRKPLASVNPLFAKVSDLPPTPNVENITFEHISLNLPIIAKNALAELDSEENSESDIEKEVEQNHLNTDKENLDFEDILNESESEQSEGIVNMNQEEILASENDEDSKIQEEEEDIEVHIYNEEELNEMTNEELKDVCDEFGIEYDDENIDRDSVISDIIDFQNNSDNE